jgi:hypothetical protein
MYLVTHSEQGYENSRKNKGILIQPEPIGVAKGIENQETEYSVFKEMSKFIVFREHRARTWRLGHGGDGHYQEHVYAERNPVFDEPYLSPRKLRIAQAPDQFRFIIHDCHVSFNGSAITCQGDRLWLETKEPRLVFSDRKTILRYDVAIALT